MGQTTNGWAVLVEGKGESRPRHNAILLLKQKWDGASVKGNREEEEGLRPRHTLISSVMQQMEGGVDGGEGEYTMRNQLWRKAYEEK